MFRNLSTAVLAMLTMTGCILNGGSGSWSFSTSTRSSVQYDGDVTFTWSFAGFQCSDVPAIRSVVIAIPGQTLAAGGAFNCLNNGYPGIVLKNFAAGRYDYTIEARGLSNEVLYASSGTFVINGNVRETVDLTPANGPSSYAYLSWTFPQNANAANPTCAQAGVQTMTMRIDQGANIDVACREGEVTGAGAVTPYLAAGTHTVELTATDATGYRWYVGGGTFVTRTGQPTASTFGMTWSVGGAAIRWQLTTGTYVVSCAQAGVTSVAVNFRDSTGQLVYGASGDVQACSSAGVLYNALQAGSYDVIIKAYGASGAVFSSSVVAPMRVTVVAGHFVGESDNVPVPVARVQ